MKRRDFLKVGGVGLAAAALAPVGQPMATDGTAPRTFIHIGFRILMTSASSVLTKVKMRTGLV